MYREYLIQNKQLKVHSLMHEKVNITLNKYEEVCNNEEITLYKIIKTLEEPDYIFYDKPNYTQYYYEKNFKGKTLQVTIAGYRNKEVISVKIKEVGDRLLDCVYGKEIKEVYDLYSRYYF